jgi:glycosyltransferase involved in cell wall biosynthesis
LGYVDDAVVPALMRQASAVVYPSRGEGFGLPVLEALACGARVVTSRATVMEEVAGDAATYFTLGDTDELVATLERVLAAPRDDEGRVGARARAERFTWDATVDQHLAAYQLAQERFMARRL